MTVSDLHRTSTALPALVSEGLTYRDADGSTVEYAHLDHGATTPAFAAVAQEVAAAAVTYSSVHRGAGFASRVTSSRYEQARETVATFVGAREDDQVVFTRNTTDSFNLLARALPEDTLVFVFGSEHHAALLPWPRALRLPVPHSHDEALDLLEQALRNHPAEHRLVVATGASNVTGEHWPVERLAALAHEHDARFALDAAQVVPHRRVDIEAIGADWIAFSGHKIYAPFGAGVLVGRSDWLDAATPYLAGGGATARVSLDETEWTCGPARHEAGSPNVLGAVALASVEQREVGGRGAHPRLTHDDSDRHGADHGRSWRSLHWDSPRRGHLAARACLRSSAGQSKGLLIPRSQVRVLPGARRTRSCWLRCAHG